MISTIESLFILWDFIFILTVGHAVSHILCAFKIDNKQYPVSELAKGGSSLLAKIRTYSTNRHDCHMPLNASVYPEYVHETHSRKITDPSIRWCYREPRSRVSFVPTRIAHTRSQSNSHWKIYENGSKCGCCKDRNANEQKKIHIQKLYYLNFVHTQRPNRTLECIFK